MQQYIVIEEVLPPSADMAVPSTELAYVTMAGAASRYAVLTSRSVLPGGEREGGGSTASKAYGGSAGRVLSYASAMRCPVPAYAKC
eukprot:1547061-Rhodomonas_salina.2